MEKILCLPHQLGMISIDGVDVPISVVFWDSDGADVPFDSSVVVSDSVAGAAAAQTLFYWTEQTVSAPPGTVVGGAIHVLSTATGEGLAISNSGTSLGNTNSRGFAANAYVTPATSPIRLAPGETMIFGRERAITPAGGIGGGGVAGSPGLAVANQFGSYSSVVVSTSPLRVLGASSWTSDQTNGLVNRNVLVANCDPSAELLLGYGVLQASLVGVVTSVKFEAALGPKGYDWFPVPSGYELVAVRAAASVYAASAREVLR